MSENRKVADCRQSVYPLGAKMDGDSPKTSENKEKLCFLSNKLVIISSVAASHFVARYLRTVCLLKSTGFLLAYQLI